MNEKELAEVRGRLAELEFVTYGLRKVEGIGLRAKLTPSDINQILNTPIPIEGGVCPECNGVGYYFPKLTTTLCPECKGTGKLDKTFTIKEAIERMMCNG